ncbi:MAG: MerR family transcriptional regulator [Deltaproteobacteria bacterium]|nr:MerR family transcriptional regulator [Deltaproteobacteria bacterium]
MTDNVKEMNGLYPMRVVSNLTGLSADTIRVWERRYGAVAPDRTDGNKRRYGGGHVRRLVLLRRVTELGHSIGQVVHLSDQELRRLIGDSSPEIGSQVSLYAAIVEDYLKAIFEYDVRRAESILTRTAAILPPMTLTLEVIVPLMRRVGEAWNADQLRIPHEHIISGQLRSLLGALMRHEQPASGAPRIIVATPPNHLHEFGAIIGAFMAAGRGFEPIYLGTHMPLEEVAEAAEQSGASLVLLSVARDCEPGEAHDLIADISALANQHEVWLGVPEQHVLSRFPLPVRLLHRYEDLDVALTTQPARRREKSG